MTPEPVQDQHLLSPIVSLGFYPTLGSVDCEYTINETSRILNYYDRKDKTVLNIFFFFLVFIVKTFSSLTAYFNSIFKIE